MPLKSFAGGAFRLFVPTSLEANEFLIVVIRIKKNATGKRGAVR